MKLILTLLAFLLSSLAIASEKNSLTRPQQSSLDNVLKMCRALGPWPIIGDKDFCSCMTGNLGHFITEKEGFKLEQVETHLESVVQAVKAKNLKSERLKNVDPISMIVPIADAVTRDLYDRVGFVCETDVDFSDPGLLIGISKVKKN